MITKKLILSSVVTLILVSCESIETKNKELFNSSYQQWENLKKLNGNSYKYITTFSSWTGYSAKTGIQVKDDIITSRECVVSNFNYETLSYDTIEHYTESANEIGIHEIGANPLTIDELYDTCAKEYLKVNTKNNTIYLETNQDGLLNLCGFVPEGCVDDCYFGIRIDTIMWVK